jgi:integrase
MATARLTKQTVTSAQPGARDALIWDSKVPGFGLKVTPSGAKVFVYQFRLGGRGAKVRRYTIGKLGPFTPDTARSEAERLAMLVAQGLDPQRQKVESRRQAVVLAFSTYIDRFERDRLKIEWPASAGEVRAMLDRYAVPILKDTPLPAITRTDIRDVLAQVRQRPATSAKLFAVLRHMFRWAVNEGDLVNSPLEGMVPPKGAASRDRVLEDWEIVRVWCGTLELGYPFGPMVRLLLLNGSRREEVAALSWNELRRDEASWLLPAERAKNGHATTIFLSTLSNAEIEALAARQGKADKWPRRGLVFTTNGTTCVSGYSRAKKRLDAAIAKLAPDDPMKPWRLHDLRRTLATGLQRLGVRFEVTEAILNHVTGSRSGVAGVYQRHDWASEKKAALQAWSDHVERLVSGADTTNVIPLEKARA